MKITIKHIYFLALLFFFCLLNCCTSKEKKDASFLKASSSSKSKIEIAKSIDTLGMAIKNNGLVIDTIEREKWIFDTILSLDEVKKEDKFLRKQTKGQRHLSVAIYRYPNETDNYYWVKAWEDNGDAFATHFNFYVYPKTKKIMFYDTLNDTLLDVQTWKKSYKYFNFK